MRFDSENCNVRGDVKKWIYFPKSGVVFPVTHCVNTSFTALFSREENFRILTDFTDVQANHPKIYGNYPFRW